MEFAKLIHNKVFKDNRGTFAPLSLKYENSSIIELNKNWVQSNISLNPVKHTLRGLHFQVGDKAQCKLIKVINGSIIDFVVDIRPESPEYMSVQTFGMDPNDELLVPRGYAHGFITLEDNTIVQYLVDNDYSPESEGSIYWKEVDIVKNILKRYENSIIISDKDLITKNFKR
jgi:dTDP-4-dehydrorhamnose 3,5-epimerase